MPKHNICITTLTKIQKDWCNTFRGGKQQEQEHVVSRRGKQQGQEHV